MSVLNNQAQNSVFEELLNNESFQSLLAAFRQFFGDVGIAEAILGNAVSSLQSFAADSEFDRKMASVFGEGNEYSIWQTVFSTGSFIDFPAVEILDGETLQGANAAYAGSSNTIYFSSDFLRAYQNQPEVIASVFLEELGHHVDWQVNDGVDTPGDEGEMFAALTQGFSLEDEKLESIKNENDFLSLQIDGLGDSISVTSGITENHQALMVEQAVNYSNGYTWNADYVLRQLIEERGQTRILFINGIWTDQKGFENQTDLVEQELGLDSVYSTISSLNYFQKIHNSSKGEGYAGNFFNEADNLGIEVANKLFRPAFDSYRKYWQERFPNAPLGARTPDGWFAEIYASLNGETLNHKGYEIAKGIVTSADESGSLSVLGRISSPFFQQDVVSVFVDRFSDLQSIEFTSNPSTDLWESLSQYILRDSAPSSTALNESWMNDLNSWLSLSESNSAIIVAHSQGNFFIEDAFIEYSGLFNSSLNPDRLKILGLGSPTDYSAINSLIESESFKNEATRLFFGETDDPVARLQYPSDESDLRRLSHLFDVLPDWSNALAYGYDVYKEHDLGKYLDRDDVKAQFEDFFYDLHPGGYYFPNGVVPGTGAPVPDGMAGGDLLVGGGTSRGDWIETGDLDDTLNGYERNDVLRAQGGNDTLIAGPGWDFLDGGAGFDTADYSSRGEFPIRVEMETVGLSNQAFPTPFSHFYKVEGIGTNDVLVDIEKIIGSSGGDTMYGGVHTDRFWGYGGNDRLIGSDGNDFLYGQAGSDTLHGGGHNDFLDGGNEDDSIDYITGGFGNDTIKGWGGDDELEGQGDNDEIYGGDGSDIIYGGGGIDTIYGDKSELEDDDGDIIQPDPTVGIATEASFSFPTPEPTENNFSTENILLQLEASPLDANLTAYNDTIYGGEGGDFIYGELGQDLIFGEGGNDQISGGEDDDTIQGNEGDDLIYGDAGNDDISGNENDDEIYGGEGDDLIAGDGGQDYIEGNTGNDNISGGDDDDYLEGNEGDDLIHGDDGNDIAIGGAGDDSLNGNDGDDELYGEAGNDALDGGVGDDILDGADGNDTLLGGIGDDELFGGVGDDSLDGGDGNDLIDGGDGIDEASFASSSVGVRLNLDNHQSFEYHPDAACDDCGDGIADPTPDFFLAPGEAYDELDQSDTLLNIEHLISSNHDDVVMGSQEGNWIRTLAGDDVIAGHAGNDTLDGGDGNDTVSYGWDPDTVWVDLARGEATGGHDDYDQLISIENAVGSKSDDVLQGSAVDNILIGNDGNDYLEGRAGDDRLSGGEGHDMLDGGDGNDQLSGGAGNDTVHGGEGEDILCGGDDDDQLRGGDDDDTLQGDDGNDQLWGDDGDDLADGGLGNDSLYGGYGSDTLQGGYGHDSLRGEADEDFLYGDAGNDSLYGGDGDDWLDGGRHDDSLRGEDGDDRLYGGSGNDFLGGSYGYDYLDGGAGHDSLTGDSGQDTLLGGAGDDTLDGGTSNDILDGGAGDDSLRGGSGSDELDGGSGDDVLKAGSGSDTLIGGSGDDVLEGSSEADYLEGGSGDDRLIGGTEEDTLSGGMGHDSLYGEDGYDWLEGDMGHDSLNGGTGNDTLFGDAGDDILKGDRGNDLLDGGSGDDTLFGGRNADVLLGGSGRDVLHGDEGDDDLQGGTGDDVLHGRRDRDTLDGGSGNDELFGGDHADILLGDRGDDTLQGGHGDDLLNGGTGRDLLTGGTGQDTFILAVNQGADTIQDFNVRDDRLGLAGLDYSQLFITQGIGEAENDALIQFQPTGEILASLVNVQADLLTSDLFHRI